MHVPLVGGLLAVLALEVAKNLTSVRGPGLVAIGVAGGVGGGLLYARWDGLKLWLRYLAPAPLVFALVFLVISPASKLVLPQPERRRRPDPPGVRINPEHPVVMLLLDEFPVTSLLNSKGQVDARLYPNLAKLAGQSTWYRNATAVSGLTNWAVPSMLSGRYPTKAQEGRRRRPPSTPTTCSPCWAGPTGSSSTRSSPSCARPTSARRPGTRPPPGPD